MKHHAYIIYIGCMVVSAIAGVYLFWQSTSTTRVLSSNLSKETKQKVALEQMKQTLDQQLASVSSELKAVKSEDQFVLNKNLQKELASIHTTYGKAATMYEKLLDFKTLAKNTEPQDKLFAAAIRQLSNRNFASADADLTTLGTQIDTEKAKIASAFSIPANIPVNNAAPGSGYRRQSVETDIGTFMVDIIAADLNSTRVIVDTASDGDCKDNCPVLALGDYVSRSGAYAGINGSYFCPSTYPSCAGKTNSFDTLIMNKNHKYINSDNNVYSTVPAVIFSGNSARFVGRSLEWGRDTGVDAVLANQPLLVSGGKSVFGGDADPKHAARGPRSFVGANGSTAYIGIVYNASVAEGAKVLEKLGMQNALNLDSGGSTALWFQGYKAGPGRGIPNAILFVRK